MTTHLYHGVWQTGQGQQITSIDPDRGDTIWQGSAARQAEVDSAVDSARSGFEHWSSTSLEDRIAVLEQYQKILTARKQDLADLITREAGKAKWESATEAATMIGKVQLSINAYHERTGSKQNDSGAIKTHLEHRPHGVLVVLGPYNFPGHLPNGHIVPALLAGNSIIFKPSEQTPAVGELMVKCLIEAGVPSGVINLLQGAGETGMLLSQHAGIDGLLFTGSSHTGAAIHKQFGGQPGKMLALEMGGNNPLIVHKVNNIKAAVFHTLQSAYITAGQRCTCARRLILVKDDAGQQFIDALVDAINKLSIDLPSLQENVFYGPVISNHVADQLLNAEQQMRQSGAHSLVAMQRLYPDKPVLRPGLIDVTAMPFREDQEHFGPLLQLIWVDTLEQAIDEANNTRFGLAAGMLTDDDEAWQQYYSQARCGILNRNRPTTGASGAAPFGGTGASGNHRPSAFYAADYCAYPTASMSQDLVELPDNLGVGIEL